LSQNQDGEGLSCEIQHDMPDDMTIWKEVAPKGKKGKIYGLGSIGTHACSKSIVGSCSNAFKETNIEQELLKWKEKAKEQELINQEQKHKLEQQQKRIESTEGMLVALFGKLNMPLPPNFARATPMQAEPNDIAETSDGHNDDNFGFDR
jgi:lactate dehydrogenase-like 2-hydroxyacid dehydrogenase